MFRPVSLLPKRLDARLFGTRSKARSLWTGEDATTASQKRLLLFDIASNQSPFSIHRVHSSNSFLRAQNSFSPNTIRSRLALHYKGLPYTESWISFPDIEPLWQELKIPPRKDVSGNQRRTSPTCTLPILLIDADGFGPDALKGLHDAKVPGVHETVQTRYGIFTPVVSSLSIAMALEVLFRGPERYPSLFPDQHSLEQTRQVQGIITRILPATRRLIIPSVPDILDDRGREYFIRTRSEWFEVSSLDELRPKTQEEMDRLWANIEAELDPILRALQDCPQVKGPELHDALDWNSDASTVHGSSDRVRYLSGTSSPTYADFILMAFLAWIARIDMDAWARLTLHFGHGVLEDLWMGCLPYLRSGGYVGTLEWFRPVGRQQLGHR
ncbi:hypothetical protein Z517_10561 [Fonsecaea pedrosoi CBS 271.37]|uniref:GST N-terminal domain-containing protein n=1 Tax=Fonsecaea pedrosoi CBS 271.37 TaxID=1442368 RepID=A0A0D2EN52_9EURO|nr:uncharacterized protein Z517_10561 [Fonsecaea pedrosoi CBS 271.37]KIW75817.1 hypothetical protein Z517_10561 [Fonsecaea pedrosoi CBS 271.37]